MIAKIAKVDRRKPNDSYCLNDAYIFIGVFPNKEEADKVNVDFGKCRNVSFTYIECESGKINGTTIGTSWYYE